MLEQSFRRSLSYAPITTPARKRAHRRLDDHIDCVERATSNATEDGASVHVESLIYRLDELPTRYRHRAVELIGQVGAEHPERIFRQVEDVLRYAVFQPGYTVPLTDALTAVADEHPEAILPHLDLFVTAADFHSWSDAHEGLSETLATLADRGYEDSLAALCDGLLADPNRREQGLDVLVLVARENPGFAEDYLDEVLEDLDSRGEGNVSRACDVLVELARDRPAVLHPEATNRLCQLAGITYHHAYTGTTLGTCKRLVALAPDTLGGLRRTLLNHVKPLAGDDPPVEVLQSTYEKHPGQSAAMSLVNLIAEQPDAIPATDVDRVTDLLEGTAAFYEEHAPEHRQGFTGPRPRDDPSAATKLERAADQLRAHHADPG